jgi:flagellar hook-length control protein FliK
MQHSSNITLLKALDNSPSAAAPANSYGSFKDVPAPVQSFNCILQDQLNSVKSNPYELNNYKNNELLISDKSNFEKTSRERQETGINPNNRQITDNEKVVKDKSNTNFNNSGKEDIQKIENADTRIKIKNKNEDDKAEHKNKISKDVQENKIKNKNERINDDVAFILKDINYILNLIKGVHLDKKQMQEVKSTLSELKNTLESKNNHTNPLDKNSGIALNGIELKKMLEKLKSLLEAANDRAGFKNIKNFDGHNLKNAENNNDTLEIGGLKKQISKLVDEIKQHLNNKKSENVISKNDESVNENKNLNNQKLFHEASAGEKNEGSQTRDSASNFNFSSFKKDIEGAGTMSQKGNVPGAEKRSVFGDELNTVMQNAKLVVRDSKNGSFSIRLHPESLGRVNVNLNLEQGVIVGKFLVDNIEAKEALLENIQSVIDRLQENGIAVGDFNVNVRDEKKSLPDFNGEVVSHKVGRNQPIAAGMGYETNSSYIHNGEIDVII